MDQAEIESRVRKVLAEQLAVDEAQVVPDARFAEDLNADSLDLVEAVLALEEEWSIEIPEEEMEDVKTVGQAIDLVAHEARETVRRARMPAAAGRHHRASARSLRSASAWTTSGRASRRAATGSDGSRRSTPPICPCKVAGEVADFDPAPWLDPKEVRRTDRFVHYAVRPRRSRGRTPARRRSRRSARAWSSPPASAGSRRCSRSTSCCSRRAPGACRPFMVPALMANAAGGHVAMRFGFTGPNLCTVSACSSSNHAIGEGDAVRSATATSTSASPAARRPPRCRSRWRRSRR